jgi:hypothetical protein
MLLVMTGIHFNHQEGAVAGLANELAVHLEASRGTDEAGRSMFG